MEHLHHSKKVIVMMAVISAMLFVSLSQTIVNTALPRIVAELGGIEYFSWVFSMFLLASSVPAVLIGKLSDSYGRRPFFLMGMVIFMVGSLFSGLARSIFHLIVSRGVQGLGGGMILVVSNASVGDLFAPQARARWQGFLQGVFGVSSLFGPFLGGYIVDNADWRWVFWIFLPMGLLALSLIYKLYPQVERKQIEETDYYGTLLMTMFAISLLLSLTWGGKQYAWASPVIISLLAVSLLTFIGFYIVECRVKNPLLPMKLFNNKAFAISIMVGCLLGVGFFGVSMYMPFYVQGAIGASATSSGFVIMPMTVSLVIASALSGQIVTRTGKYKKVSLAGLSTMVAGLLLAANMNPHTPIFIGALNMILVGVGLGIALPIYISTTQNAVKNEQLGIATAAFQMSRQFGGTIGVAVLGIIMNNRLTLLINQLFSTSAVVNFWEKEPALAETMVVMRDPQILMDVEKLARIKVALPPQFEESFLYLLQSLRSALSSSLNTLFVIMAAAVMVAFLIGLFLEEIPLRSINKSE